MGFSTVVTYVVLIEHPNLRNMWWVIIGLFEICYTAILLIFTSKNIYWAISILVFKDLVSCFIYSSMIEARPSFHKGLFSIAYELLQFGFFPMVASLMTTLNYRIDVIMLKQYSIITDSMIGIYSIGILFSEKIILIPETLQGVLVSKLAKGANESEVAKVCRLGLLSSLLICIGAIVLGDSVIHFLFGAEFDGAYKIVLITAIGVLAVSYFKIIAQYNVVYKRQKLNVYMLSIAIIVDVFLNTVFIPVWGIDGAALATSIAHVLCGIVFIIYFSTKSGIPVSKMIVLQKNDIAMIYTLFKDNRKT